jgi:hypothetical protein
MAKKSGIKSYYTGPNTSLITGAGNVGLSNIPEQKYIDFSSSFNAASTAVRTGRAAVEAARQAQQAKAEALLTNLEYQDFSGSIPSYTSTLESGGKFMTNQIYDLSVQEGQTNDPQEKLMLKSRRTKLENQVKNMAKLSKDLADGAKEDLEDIRLGNYSMSTSLEDINFVQDVLGGLAESAVIDGVWSFKRGEEWVPADKLPDIRPIASEEFKTISQSNQSYSNKTKPLTAADEQAMRTELNGLLKSKDAILSLATDDFIIEGGMGIFADPAEAEAAYKNDPLGVKNMVLDSYLNMYKDTWNTGYQDYMRKKNQNTGGSGDGGSGDGGNSTSPISDGEVAILDSRIGAIDGGYADNLTYTKAGNTKQGSWRIEKKGEGYVLIDKLSTWQKDFGSLQDIQTWMSTPGPW